MNLIFLLKFVQTEKKNDTELKVWRLGTKMYPFINDIHLLQ